MKPKHMRNFALAGVGALFASCLSAPALADPVPKVTTSPAPDGANDFDVLTRFPVLQTCLFFFLCDRDMPSDLWGSQTTKNELTPDGFYLNAWSGATIVTGGTLTFDNLPLSNVPTAGGNFIIEQYWTKNGVPIDFPVMLFFLNNPRVPIGDPGGRIYVAGPVPEPASWAMMVSGFGLAGIALRRRRTALGGLAAIRTH
jgi:hypothetical protein